MNDKTQTLFRPVGLKEAELILETDARAFPPRLDHQPIFYPVLNFVYAEQIARDWNTKDAASEYAGFVTEFQVKQSYVNGFEVHKVGASIHQELWVPAQKLEEFNRHIIGRINLKAAFYGKGFAGARHFNNKDFSAKKQFLVLYRYAMSNAQDFSGEMTLNRNAILLNYQYWVEHNVGDSISLTEKQDFLRYIVDEWQRRYPDIHLIGSDLLNEK